MAAAVAITPESGSITAVETACRVDVSGAADNDPDTFDAGNSPSMDPIVYFLKATAAGEEDLDSPRFTPSADGDYQWNGLIFPAAGTWSLSLRYDDGSIAEGALIEVTVA